jgi:hypothetical protein
LKVREITALIAKSIVRLQAATIAAAAALSSNLFQTIQQQVAAYATVISAFE